MVIAMIAVMAQVVSFHHEVAPVLAFHCNRCHGDEGLAGGLSTRGYADLLRGGSIGPAVIPGDPEGSLLMEFVDGRRGEARRMPLGAAPLDAGQIGRLRRWIAEGALEDRDASPRYRLSLPGVHVRRGGALRIVARMPVRAYVEVVVSAGGRLLHREAAAMHAPGEASWNVRAEKGWPRRVVVEMEVRYADRAPIGMEIAVDGHTSAWMG